MGTMKTCPKCRTLITTRAINFSLLGAIEQFEQQKTELLKLRARQSAQTREQDVTSGTLNELKNSLGNLKLESEAMQRQRAQETLAQINYLQNQVHQQVNQRQITDLNVQIIALQNRLSRENQSKDRRVEELEAKILEMQHKQQQPQTPRVDPVMEAKIAELERKLESSMQTSGRTMNWKAAFIRGLPESAKEKQIMHLVRLVNIDPEKEDVRIQLYTPATRGTCLVTFSTKESATKFIKNFDGQEFLSTGKKLKVEQASFDSRKQAADGQAKGTPAAAPTFVADKKKVFIRGLPVNVTPADVTKWIFEDSKKLLGNSVTVKLAGPVATCIAMFQDEASAKKILDKWNGKLYPGTSKELSVDYWKVLEGSISKNEPKSQKKGENNEKNEQKLKPQNQQTQKDQQKSEMQKSLPGNIVFLRNLPLETTESDLVVMFHQRAQIAQNPGDRRNKIDFQAAGANAKFKFAKITFVTDQDAQKIVREFDGKKFPNSDRVMGAAIFGQKKAEKAAGPSGGQNKKNNQTATNIVVVKGLPFETTVNDIVAKFHGVSKIQMDPNGYERVTLHKNPDGTPTGRATIVFKEADGAQKIVFEFNNADFQIGHSRPRKIQVELFNFKR
ncbi:unnamed protein product, partial [Mesorhabditis belari]|uniref:RRM domain-containing protein n=1 Tax=Mesorhabditis belari TaxID=2138241 RepID=A0AAF3ED55_9BILA